MLREKVQCLVLFVAEGPLKKLYEHIRTQRESWQQRSLNKSRDAAPAAAVDASPGEFSPPVCVSGKVG